MPTPAAMRHLADLRQQLGRIERLRLRLIDGQPVQAGDLLPLIDRARDAIAAEMRQAKARLRQKRAA
jgi:multidrug resistance efflux pump